MPNVPVTAEPVATTRQPLPPAEVATLAQGTNRFAFALFAKARVQTGNLVVSPTSVFAALAMASAGARSSTEAEMRKVLGFEGTADEGANRTGKFLADLQALTPVEVRIANRLFGEKSLAFEPSYVERTKQAFGASLAPIDFRGAPDEARQFINRWVSGQTNNRVQDLLPVGTVDSETRLALVNAISFVGDWATPFDPTETAPAPFHSHGGGAQSVPTMHHVGQYSFAASDGVKVLELPYAGGALSLTLVLPDAPLGLDALEKRMQRSTLEKWSSASSGRSVSVALPKFKIDPSAPLRLSRPLQSMGMGLAFDADKADFSGIAATATAHPRLRLSEVFHKAFIKIDEKGTEAAAATGGLAVAGAALPNEKVAEFHADHPFLFFLRDRSSGMILFMGRVADPGDVR